MVLPDFTTPATDALCRDIAKRSKGVCFLGFSRGKDSLVAWLQLRRYFTRIIPFTCNSIPGMKFIDATLAYYEDAFQTRILRLMGEDLKMALTRYVYQEFLDDCDDIDEAFGEVKDYSKLDILDYLRYKYSLPRAWCAFGIQASDSIDRLIYCRQTGGKSEDHRTFYPCWDWPRAEMVRAIKESGLRVSSEYKYSKRSMGGVPCATYNRILKKHYPQDWETLLKWYPLAEVKNYREEMLKREAQKRRDTEIAARGGKSEEEEKGAERGEEISEIGENELLPMEALGEGEDING